MARRTIADAPEEVQIARAKALAAYLRSDACPYVMDAQPIRLRLGTHWYAAAEYQDKVPQQASEGEEGYVTRAAQDARGRIAPHGTPNIAKFELRIYVLGKPHWKNKDGHQPVDSCPYVFREVAYTQVSKYRSVANDYARQEWRPSMYMDVEFTRAHHAQYLNPDWEKYHPFGSWFIMRTSALNTPFKPWRTRISMEIQDV